MLDFLWGWFSTVYRYFLGKSAKIVFVGLANAGKSTLMDLLRTGKLSQLPPTAQTRSACVTMGNVTFTLYDLGGHRQARRVWYDYFLAVDAVVFVVDSADLTDLAEATNELHRVLEDEQISRCPVLVLGNKIDMSGAISRTELISRMGLYGITTETTTSKSPDVDNKRPLEVFMCSLKKRQGYGEAFRWLSTHV